MMLFKNIGKGSLISYISFSGLEEERFIVLSNDYDKFLQSGTIRAINLENNIIYNRRYPKNMQIHKLPDQDKINNGSGWHILCLAEKKL